jgi:hypothetical protein
VKGYEVGLLAHRRCGLSHIWPVRFMTDDTGVSFTVSLRGNGVRVRAVLCLAFRRGVGICADAMCEGSCVKETALPFQLESLILAQNERWRQA